MNFQTVFYKKATGEILNVIPNKYIKSKYEKLRLCPGAALEEVNFLYFPSGLPIDPAIHKVNNTVPGKPAQIVEPGGIPLVYTDRRQNFIEQAERFSTIIVDMADSMGDNLFRAAAVLEAQRVYPNLKFYCKVWPPFKEVMALVPGLTILSDGYTGGMDPKRCGLIKMEGGILSDPRGQNYSKASLYGLFLNLQSVPYNTRLVLPPEFKNRFTDFAASIDLPDDGLIVVMQLRSKNWEGKSWETVKAVELARLIREVYDCQVYFVGTGIDMIGEHRDIINLAGKTTWLQTVYLLTEASHVFCIDSACLHLCRGLGKAYLCLWGETHPRQILGEDPGPQDIVSTFQTAQSDIKAITAQQVFNRAFPEQAKAEALTYDPAKNTSQHGDQEVIFKYFSEHPPQSRTLVDVGAFGRDMSNTFALLQLGWKGLMIEANPDRFKACEKDFAGLDVKILNIGIGSAKGRLPLHLHSELGHDSFLEDWYPQDKMNKTLSVEVRPLKDVLIEEGVPEFFDLLSVDTEGLDEKIMKKFLSNSDFRPALIITEAASYVDAPALFKKYGYSLLVKTGNTEYGNFVFSRD